MFNRGPDLNPNTKNVALFKNCSQQTTSNQPAESGVNLPGRKDKKRNKKTCHCAKLVGTFSNRLKTAAAEKEMILPNTSLKGLNSSANNIFLLQIMNFVSFCFVINDWNPDKSVSCRLNRFTRHCKYLFPQMALIASLPVTQLAIWFRTGTNKHFSVKASSSG